ncbi:MAG: sugar phosphate nucleotidyltransferase [Patescibacteria group bacterium]|jgi:glucose-1-phosphate thymidylyltransferase
MNMKGIILAGGQGTRLRPLTYVTNKQLLPVYNKPMIYYPLNTLLKAGIKNILIISGPDKIGDFSDLLGSGRKLGAKISYEIQDEPRGLAEAFILGEDFIGKSNVAMILGDNIFEDDFSEELKNFKSGGKIFLKKVSDPERFGVAELNSRGGIKKIVEKPKKHISDQAITGLYVYDSRSVEIAKNIKPSSRGELEIVDIHNWYLKNNELDYTKVKGKWLDVGTFDSLLQAQNFAKEKMQGKMVI